MSRSLSRSGSLQVPAENATYDTKGEGGISLLAALPKLMAAIRTYNDNTKPTLRVIGNGSSVGVGATLPDPLTQAPVARLFSQLSPVINRLGNLTLTNTNGSVNGSTIQQGADTDYATAKTTAGGTPSLVVLAYGMNDGQSAQYHTGQTYPAVYTAGRKLLAQANQDGADAIIMTSPHPHSTRNPWGLAGLSPTYPTTGAAIPLDTLAGSVVTVKSPSGANVSASYRHLRVNEALRQLAADTGSVLLDVEKYWFDALAAYGEDALFNTAEYAHPNLLGHQQSYWKAIDALVRGFQRPPIQAAGVAAQRSVIDSVTIGANQILIASGGSVVIAIPANTVGELTVWGSSGGAWHSVYIGSVIANATAVAVAQSSTGFVAPGNVISGVAGSGTTLNVTVSTAATGSAGEVAWSYTYFTP